VFIVYRGEGGESFSRGSSSAFPPGKSGRGGASGSAWKKKSFVHPANQGKGTPALFTPHTDLWSLAAHKFSCFHEKKLFKNNLHTVGFGFAFKIPFSRV
jgi:hypothetical protein